MRPDIKSGIEYALITLLAAGLCLWLLISGANEEDPSVAQLALTGLGLVVTGAMHCVFMMQLVRRTGRRFAPWFVAIVIFMPVGTAVLLALLLGESEASES
jgi:drug/metabolite transporter (DMT)-like permease